MKRTWFKFSPAGGAAQDQPETVFLLLLLLTQERHFVEATFCSR